MEGITVLIPTIFLKRQGIKKLRVRFKGAIGNSRRNARKKRAKLRAVATGSKKITLYFHSQSETLEEEGEPDNEDGSSDDNPPYENSERDEEIDVTNIQSEELEKAIEALTERLKVDRYATGMLHCGNISGSRKMVKLPHGLNISQGVFAVIGLQGF